MRVPLLLSHAFPNSFRFVPVQRGLTAEGISGIVVFIPHIGMYKKSVCLRFFVRKAAFFRKRIR